VRPINLIPPEDRRGEKTPLRTGPLGYAIVAVLALALGGVTLMVITGNQISDRKAEKSNLEAELAQAQAEAKRLSAYTDFAALQQAREDTVSSLATSRFDWERVLRELAIVIPHDVWLTDLTASASAEAGTSASGSSSSSSTSSVTQGILGPSLSINGCATGHEAVARFLASLRDVDGVTRVTVVNSDRHDSSGDSTSTTSTGTGGSGSCATRGFISTFGIVVAFDEAQPGVAATSPVPSTSSQPSAADQSQVSDGQQELKQQNDSANQKTAQGRDAVETFIPGTGTTP
jgi:Tfp pilus assembly protein PilN